MDKQQYIAERLASFTPEYRDFLSSGIAEGLADIHGEGYQMNSEAIDALENGIMLFLMLFLDQQGLMEFIRDECNLLETDARRLRDNILDALPPSMLYEFNRISTGQPATAPTTPAPVVPTPEELEKRQQLADLANKFATPAPVAQPAPQPAPVPPQTAPAFQSVASQMAAVPTAQPRSSAQLTSMSVPLAESQLQPAVAQAAENVPPQWSSAPVSNISPVQTMDADAQRIHGYGAYRDQYPHLYGSEEQNRAAIRSVAQDALLKRPSVVDTPDFRNSPQQ